MVLKDRGLYIGGSEANYLYANYNTKTFKLWWSQKLAGIDLPIDTNRNMEVGTILESSIIDLYEEINNVKGKRDQSKIKGIARGNTDYILGDKVCDVKATKHAYQWFLTGTIPIEYRRQLLHYCYVFGLNKASIIAYQVEEELHNPFMELDERKLFEIDVKITSDKLQEHERRLKILEECRNENKFPEVKQ